MQGTNPVFEYLSEDMKREYKHYVQCHNNHSAVLNEAMKLYISELKRKQRIQELRSGYEQMAEINLDYAESGFVGDITSLNDYENNLKMRKK
jgi:CopG family transcriptional regulator/antitoxin EndoAI